MRIGMVFLLSLFVLSAYSAEHNRGENLAPDAPAPEVPTDDDKDKWNGWLTQSVAAMREESKALKASVDKMITSEGVDAAAVQAEAAVSKLDLKIAELQNALDKAKGDNQIANLKNIIEQTKAEREQLQTYAKKVKLASEGRAFAKGVATILTDATTPSATQAGKKIDLSGVKVGEQVEVDLRDGKGVRKLTVQSTSRIVSIGSQRIDETRSSQVVLKDAEGKSITWDNTAETYAKKYNNENQRILTASYGTKDTAGATFKFGDSAEIYRREMAAIQQRVTLEAKLARPQRPTLNLASFFEPETRHRVEPEKAAGGADEVKPEKLVRTSLPPTYVAGPASQAEFRKAAGKTLEITEGVDALGVREVRRLDDGSLVYAVTSPKQGTQYVRYLRNGFLERYYFR